MRVIIDNIVFSLQKGGGISVVWYELLSRMFRDLGNMIVCINYDSNNIFFKKLNFEKIDVLKVGKTIQLLHRYINLKLTNLSSKFVFHSSYYRICVNPYAINITTVHDFTYEYYCTGIKRVLHLWQKHRAILNSDYIICISRNTQKDLFKFMPSVNPSRVRVIYNGVSDDYYPLENVIQYKYVFPVNSYILFVGGREGYKKFRLAVEAVACCTLNMIIVGNELSHEEEAFMRLKLNGRFAIMGRISNEILNYLYNGAYALLYPSEYEGFGIPVLEAQKAGCPVIAYNNSSIPEVIGDTPLLINELSTNAIINCINILKIDEVRKSIVVNGIENAKLYTWDNTYTQVMALYEEAWNSSDYK